MMPLTDNMFGFANPRLKKATFDNEGKVLVMDNDEANRKVMVDILSQEYEVYETDSGWRAIEAVNKQGESFAFGSVFTFQFTQCL